MYFHYIVILKCYGCFRVSMSYLTRGSSCLHKSRTLSSIWNSRQRFGIFLLELSFLC